MPVVENRILAVSSGGGHWTELLRLRPSFVNKEVVYATVRASYRDQIECNACPRFYRIADVTRWNKLKWIVTAAELVWILIRERPEAVITTGALPGYMAVRLGSIFGARTIWVDSIANAGRLSRSGERAGKHVDLWLTQWQHISRPGGPYYKGAVV